MFLHSRPSPAGAGNRLSRPVVTTFGSRPRRNHSEQGAPGVLKLTMAKTKEAQPRKVAIK